MTTQQAVLAVLNPVRLRTVSEFLKIADIITSEEFERRQQKLQEGDYSDAGMSMTDFKYWTTIQLMQSWETLTKQPLTKNMFVCEVEKPSFDDDYYVSDEGYKHPHTGNLMEDDLIAFKAAQREVIFEGFDWQVEVIESGVYINGKDEKGLPLSTYLKFGQETLFDFIIELDRYRRLAPIPLKFTPAIADKLLSNG